MSAMKPINCFVRDMLLGIALDLKSKDEAGAVSDSEFLQPTRKLDLRSELHKVKLHNINDLWYLG